MNILLVSIGTRGDMEPFLAIGEIFKQKGHKVICLFPEQFRRLAEDADMSFATLGAEFIEMLESELGKLALGGSSRWKRMTAYIKLARMQNKNNRLFFERQQRVIEQENPDIIVHNAKALYPIIWQIENKGKTIYVSPVPYLHYVKGHAHIFFNGHYGNFLNKLSYKFANWAIIKAIMFVSKDIRRLNISKHQINHVLAHQKTIYTISPQLFPQPSYWEKNLKVLGYHERDKTLKWTPTEGIEAFINKHPKCIVVTFGSMTNSNPEKKTKIILSILSRYRIPAIINTSSGGLAKPHVYESDLFFFVPDIPYDWIFPKVYGVIHHGGSGTTHMALKYGCANMIIPHIIDQFVWDKIVAKIGAGPRGIKIGKINEKNLEPKIIALFHNVLFKQKAQQIACLIKKEDFKEVLYNTIME